MFFLLLNSYFPAFPCWRERNIADFQHLNCSTIQLGFLLVSVQAAAFEVLRWRALANRKDRCR
jgi:hypothetical protein